MSKFTAYCYLVIFGALALLGSLMIAITPQTRIMDERYPDENQTIFVVALALVSLLIAYMGMYFLIRKQPRSYLATEYGYGTVVRLGCILHMVMGFLMVFAVLGGAPGSIGMHTLIFILLFGPLLARKLWLMGQRDKSFDNFLEDDQQV